MRHANPVISQDEHAGTAEEIHLYLASVRVMGVFEKLADRCRHAGDLLAAEHLDGASANSEFRQLGAYLPGDTLERGLLMAAPILRRSRRSRKGLPKGGV